MNCRHWTKATNTNHKYGRFSRKSNVHDFTRQISERGSWPRVNISIEKTILGSMIWRNWYIQHQIQIVHMSSLNIMRKTWWTKYQYKYKYKFKYLCAWVHSIYWGRRLGPRVNDSAGRKTMGTDDILCSCLCFPLVIDYYVTFGHFGMEQRTVWDRFSLKFHLKCFPV